MEIERERVGSSQNERNLGGGGFRKRTRTNKAEEGGGVKTRVSWVNVLLEFPLSGYTAANQAIPNEQVKNKNDQNSK